MIVRLVDVLRMGFCGVVYEYLLYVVCTISRSETTSLVWASQVRDHRPVKEDGLNTLFGLITPTMFFGGPHCGGVCGPVSRSSASSCVRDHYVLYSWVSARCWVSICLASLRFLLYGLDIRGLLVPMRCLVST